MNYDLAKKLKDAGFPLKGADTTTTSELVFTSPTSTAHYWILPTLSELIEACGEIFLWKWETKWCAGYHEPSDNHGEWDDCYIDLSFKEGEIGYGETPEIAVANLWLALNQK